MPRIKSYDKLNRIKQMRTTYHNDIGSGWKTSTDVYATNYSYDWNGNLLSLQRNDELGHTMHDIQYFYPAGKNRLASIAATGISSSTYQYDALGNLVRDNAEGLTVGWNAMGKVDSICRNGSSLSSFRYSPTGQRQVKMAGRDTIFYIHDATGNVMCVYQLKKDTLAATERYIYGSKRLGMLGQYVWIVSEDNAGLYDTNTIGHRIFELTDHLGNVTASLFDRKHLNNTLYDSLIYTHDIESYMDYYPFGFPMPRRSYFLGRYRYFFNGQESDAETYGSGSLHAFEYRMHDTRIGRFWSVDPLAGQFPWNSVYAFAEDRVIDGKELEGLEVYVTTTEYSSSGGIAQYGWNYVKGSGRASDPYGVTYFHYISSLKITENESVMGLMLGGVKKHIGVDVKANSFIQYAKHGATTSLDAAPFFRGSVELRDPDLYIGASAGLGFGISFATTDIRITSFSITHEELEELVDIIKTKGYEFNNSQPDLGVYYVKNKPYLKYTQHGTWFHPFRKVEIKTSIPLKNEGTKDEPLWSSDKYRQKRNKGTKQ